MPNQGSRNSPITGTQLTIGGPRLWLAYAAALGTGMCSFTFAGWVRAALGMASLADAGCEGILLTGAFLLAGFGAFLFGAWSFTRRRFENDPDLPEYRQLLILVYAAMVPTIFFAAMAPTILSSLEDAAYKRPFFEIPTSIAFPMMAWAVVAALAPAHFAVRDPRHGFFCAGLISIMSYSTLFELVFGLGEGDSIGLYVIPARMALVFIYLAASIRIQRIIAGLCGVVSICSPGVLGATLGMIPWAIRRKRTRQREAAAPKAEDGSIRRAEGEEFSTDETN